MGYLTRVEAFHVDLNVLVVDDGPTWLKIFEKMLRKCSYDGIVGAHLNAVPKAAAAKSPEICGNTSTIRTRPPITTHVLDVARGCPASGLEVILETWRDTMRAPSFKEEDHEKWVILGSSKTNSDGRSGQLMGITDYITPGFYRIGFSTGKYNPTGFFPYVSIVFEVKESQKLEHFHVPLLLSPFSFSTYRGS